MAGAGQEPQEFLTFWRRIRLSLCQPVALGKRDGVIAAPLPERRIEQYRLRVLAPPPRAAAGRR